MSDEPNYFELNNPLLGMLQSSGINVSEEALIEHFFICPDHNSSKQLAEELTQQGFNIDPKQLESDDEDQNERASLMCTEKARPDQVDNKRDDLQRIAGKYNCSYDGWGTSG